MSRKGENIYKRKDGRWEGRYIKYYDENNKAKYGYVYAKSYTVVKQKIIQIKGNIITNLRVNNVYSIHYDDLLDMWLQTHKLKVKESTYARYCSIINHHIRPFFGSYQLERISTALVEMFIETLLSEKGLAPKTVNDILTIVKSTMGYAKRKNYDISCCLEGIRIKNIEKEMRVLTHIEQSTLIDYLYQEIDSHKFGVLLSLYTGIRIGELCALQWRNISLANGVLKINETALRIPNTDHNAKTKTKIIITTPKSACSIREIPIPSFIVKIAKQFENEDDVYLLSGRSEQMIEPRTMQNHFRKYLKECGVEIVNFHTLRHTFATRCVEVGFEIKSLSEILGHANVNITLNRYVHSSFELKQRNMEKLIYPDRR